eukprot:9270409-Ditylum_brightwellii.AAC.1
MANRSPKSQCTAKRNKTKKPTLPYKRLDRPMDTHEHGRLKDCDVRPGCKFCEYDWGLRRFYREDLGCWRVEVKHINFGCTYCDFPLCKKTSLSTTQLTQQLNLPLGPSPQPRPICLGIVGA